MRRCVQDRWRYRAGKSGRPQSSLGGDQCAHAIVEGIISAMTMKPWVASCQRLPELALNTCDFSSPPAQPALYQHRDMDFLKACALRRTILAETFRLLASLVSPEGHTKCTRSTPIQLSTQLAPALCPTDCYRRGAPDKANKRQTKITVTALSASQIARKVIFGSWRIEQQQSKRSGG